MTARSDPQSVPSPSFVERDAQTGILPDCPQLSEEEEVYHLLEAAMSHHSSVPPGSASKHTAEILAMIAQAEP